MTDTTPTLRPEVDAGIDTELCYVAVGIPQGVFVERGSGDEAGVVRRGGELVSLDRVEYALWARLLAPARVDVKLLRQTWVNAVETIGRLRDRQLLITMNPNAPMDAALERLRPLPLGFGLGNRTGDAATFEIQSANLSLPVPVALDAVTIMFWWEFDGICSLGEIVARLASRLPTLGVDTTGRIASRLVYGLMANRLLYLDTPRPQESQ